MIRSSIVFLLISLAFLPNEARAAFREQRLAVVPAGGQLDFTNIVFSRDGGKTAFAVQQGDRFKVIFEARASKPYVTVRNLAISPDGRFVAHNGTADIERKAEYLVVNNIETGPFQQVCNPVFSPDSREVVFEVKHDSKWRHAVSAIDAKRIAAETETADLHWTGPVLSPDGRLVVSIQQQRSAGNNVRLVSTIDMRAVHRRTYDEIVDVVYSADGLRTAYVARKGAKRFVVTSSFAGGDEREGAFFDAVSVPVLSSDGIHVAYGAERSGQRFIVVDGEEIPAPFFYERYRPAFSRNWRTFAYGAQQEGKQYVVWSGQRGAAYDDLTDVSLSADGHMLAYGAQKNGKWRLVVNDREGPLYDYLDKVQFSPDMRSVVYRAVREGRSFVAVADLKAEVVREGQLFDRVWAPAFDSEGRLGYGALDGAEIWWKVLTVD